MSYGSPRPYGSPVAFGERLPSVKPPASSGPSAAPFAALKVATNLQPVPAAAIRQPVG